MFQKEKNKMPLTKKGMKVKGSFIQEYGKRRGTGIFYAFENSHPNQGLVKRRYI